MTIRRLSSAAAPVVTAAAILALGSAAAPARSLHDGAARPRLVVSPSKLRPARTIAPGDRIERRVQLRRFGRSRFNAVYFVARTTNGSELASNPGGLRVAIERCSRRWRGHGGRYSCPGRRSVVLASRPLRGRTKLRSLGLRRGRTAHLRLVLTFPAGAGNALQGQSANAVYTFVGVAR